MCMFGVSMFGASMCMSSTALRSYSYFVGGGGGSCWELVGVLRGLYRPFSDAVGHQIQKQKQKTKLKARNIIIFII